MHRRRACQVRPTAGLAERLLQGGRIERLPFGVGEEQVLGPMAFPVLTQFVEQTLAQRHAAVLVALAVADPEQAARPIDVDDTQVEPLGQAQAGAVQQAEEGTPALGDGPKQVAHLGRTEDDRELAGPFGERQGGDDVG